MTPRACNRCRRAIPAGRTRCPCKTRKPPTLPPAVRQCVLCGVRFLGEATTCEPCRSTAARVKAAKRRNGVPAPPVAGLEERIERLAKRAEAGLPLFGEGE